MDQITKRKDLFLLGLVFAGTTILFSYYFIFPFIVVNYDVVLAIFLVEKYEIFAYLLSLFTLIAFGYAWIKIKTRSRQGMLVLMLPFLLYISIGRIIKLTYSPPTHLFDNHVWYEYEVASVKSPFTDFRAVFYAEFDSVRILNHAHYIVLESPSTLPKTLVFTSYKTEKDRHGCDPKLAFVLNYPETITDYVYWVDAEHLSVCDHVISIHDPQRRL